MIYILLCELYIINILIAWSFYFLYNVSLTISAFNKFSLIACLNLINFEQWIINNKFLKKFVLT